MLDNIMEFIVDEAPAILTGIGIGAVLIGTVEACKASTTLSEIVEEHKEAMEEVNEKAEAVEEEGEDFNKGKEKLKVFVKTGKKIVKKYALPATAIAIGVACLVGGNVMLNTRNIALASAANSISSAYEDYRNRVIETFGEEADSKLRRGVKEVTTEEVGANGRKKKVKKEVSDPTAKGKGYGRYFTPSNPYWIDDRDQLEFMFNQEQSRANNLFQINRKYTLDKLWERLGFVDGDNCPDSMVMGWVEGVGDQFINLNVEPATIPDGNGGFIDCYFIDPNVQTNVYTTIKNRLKKSKVKSGKEGGIEWYEF